MKKDRPEFTLPEPWWFQQKDGAFSIVRKLAKENPRFYFNNSKAYMEIEDNVFVPVRESEFEVKQILEKFGETIKE